MPAAPSTTTSSDREAGVADDSRQHDATLAGRAAAGCAESFATLARRHQAAVRHYVHRLARRSGQGDADDVVQESLLRAWQGLAGYDPQWAFSTWLFSIARRSWLNHERGRQRRFTREAVAAGARPTSAEAEPAASLIAAERASQIWDLAAATLSEQEFTATWLRYVEEKPLQEIAVVLGKPEATVKTILFRARRRLEPLMKAEALE
jgi:RNA polymerase sigma-70 factor (ECF subfamily)